MGGKWDGGWENERQWRLMNGKVTHSTNVQCHVYWQVHVHSVNETRQGKANTTPFSQGE